MCFFPYPYRTFEISEDVMSEHVASHKSSEAEWAAEMAALSCEIPSRGDDHVFPTNSA